MNKLNSKKVLIFSVIIGVFILSFALLISKSRTNNITEAGQTESLAIGCYYQLNCPPSKDWIKRTVFKCEPLLICPTPTIELTPTPPKTSLNCNDCLANKLTSLCFDNTNATSYCSDGSLPAMEGSQISCISCPRPTPTTSISCQGKPDGTKCGRGCENVPTCSPGRPCAVCDPLLGTCQNGVCKQGPPDFCLQVFTWGRNLTTKVCQLFPTSCIPGGWIVDPTCSPTPSPVPSRTGGICFYNGKNYQNGEGFKAIDGCNSCSCQNGQIACTLIACPQQ